MCDACDYSEDETPLDDQPLFIAAAPIRKGEFVTLAFPGTDDRALARHVLPPMPPAPDVRAYPRLRAFGRSARRLWKRERSVPITLAAAWVLLRVLGVL